ncbi:MAG: PQQ-dependent sugar dehydrogenase [Verrucomicrobia bacterium]|nr:PQQ-dependent sugar dehydrogenase [Verrucomicrobiota bacterium]
MNPPTTPFRHIVLLACALACTPAATAADGPSGISLKLVATNLTAPTLLAPLGDAAGRMLLGEQTGLLHVLSRDGKTSQMFDFRNRMCPLKMGAFDERGLLGLALHPKARENGRFYVCYSAPRRTNAPSNWDHTMNISEFRLRGRNLDEVDEKSERILLQVDQPYFNHNGGRIAFGPDGFLYIGCGDGGHKNDINQKEEHKARGPRGNGQDLNTLLGKILRIDVDKSAGGRNYAIPYDNPFARGGGELEIFAWGIRNPWGMTFDRGGRRELFACDIGQSRWEEINIIVKGGNYGWNLREGNEWFNPVNNKELEPLDKPYVDAAGATFTGPVILYGNLKAFPQEGKGISVTGGYVYRGKALPQLQGKYVFGDWSRHFGLPQGVLFAATPSTKPGELWKLDVLEPASHPGPNIKMFVWAFGEDAEGELYVLTNDNNGLAGKTGKVWKLVKAGS